MLWLALVFSAGFTPSLWAQSAGNAKPPAWQTELTKRYRLLHQRMLRLAKQRGWPLHKNYSSNRVLQLQEVDAFGQPVYYTLHNVEAARGTRTMALWGGGSLPVAVSGSLPALAGKLGLWDGGRALASHQELAGSVGSSPRISQKDNADQVNPHTTHLAGTLIAQGINPQAKGMAFGASLSVWDYTDDITELSAAAPNLLISNHAYGPVAGWVYNASRPGSDPTLKWEWWGNTAISATENYLFGFYTVKAQDLDRVAYNNPFYLMVRSADNKRSETGPPAGTPYFLNGTTVQSTALRSRNDAYDVIPAEATAKNVLTVGAADVSFANNRPISIASTSFSGWGPTDDGRIKPDLLGIGSMVLSSVASSDTAYGANSGTSMASANVSGSLFLLQELYARQQITGSSASGQFMRAATLRGLALHTADRMEPAAGPDYRQGWGLLNTEAAARLILNEDRSHLLLEQTLTSGKIFTRQLMAQGNEPLFITLSWTDPEGEASGSTAASLNNRTPKLVNDLDLRLTSSTSTDMPFILDPNHPDQVAVRGDNFRDNVEQVYIANPVPGQTYTLSVSHKGKMTYSSQPFSVIVSGLQRIDCLLTAAIVPNRDTTICAGTPLTLHMDSPAAKLTYQWLRNGVVLTGAQSGIYQTTQPGSYALRVTNADGCSATSKPIQVAVRDAPLSITPTGNQWLCADHEPIQLKVTGTAGNTLTELAFEWLRDSVVLAQELTSTITVSQPGHYRIRMKQNDCQALSPETNVQLSSVNAVNLLPEETELMLPQGATVTLKAPADTTYRYQWYRNDSTLINAVTHQLSVAQSGVYKVKVTQQQCVGWSANRVVRGTVLTATAPEQPGQFIIYPNPAEHTLFIRCTNSSARQGKISLYDLRGSLLQQLSLKVQPGKVESELPLQHLPPGHYILQFTDGMTTETRRFLKK